MNIDFLLQQLRSRSARSTARSTAKNRVRSEDRRRKSSKIRSRVSRLESLEQRQLLAGDFEIPGTIGPDKIIVSVSGGNLNWSINGIAGTQEPIADFDNLTIDGRGGNDTIHLHGVFDVGATNDLTLIAESIFIGSDGTGGGTGAGTSVGTTTVLTADNISISSLGDEFDAGFGDNMPLSIAMDDRLVMVGDNVTINASGTLAISAERTSSFIGGKRPFGYGEKNAEIRLGSATITADSVSIDATAEDENLIEQLPEWAQNNVIGPLQEYINDGLLPNIPISVMIRESGANIALTGTNITSRAGDVSINSNTSVDASTDAVAVRDSEDTSGKSALGKILKAANNLSAGYSQATSRSIINVSGGATINAAGSVSILADASTTAEVDASTEINVHADELNDDEEKKKASPANTNALGASLAVSNTNTTSTATIAHGVTINASGNVNIHAKGEVTNAATSGLEIFVDGRGGLGVAIGLDEANITATVDGKITAGNATSLIGFPKSDADRTLGAMSNLIRIENHGFETGEELVYLAQDATDLTDEPTVGQAIGGLTHNQDVRVVVIDADHIQLTRGKSLDLDARLIAPGTTHSLQPSDAILIDPTAVAVVNAANDTIAVGSTVFTVGQRVRYAVGGSDPDTMPIDELRPIGGLVDGETYVVAAYDSVDRTIQLSQPVKAGDPRPRRRANLLHHPHQRPHDPAQRNTLGRVRGGSDCAHRLRCNGWQSLVSNRNGLGDQNRSRIDGVEQDRNGSGDRRRTEGA